MTETEFLALVDKTLNSIEEILDKATHVTNLDIESNRKSDVLEIEFIESDLKIIINSRVVVQELWVAARSCGYYYRYDGRVWRNIRDNSELLSTLSNILLEYTGLSISFNV